MGEIAGNKNKEREINDAVPIEAGPTTMKPCER